MVRASTSSTEVVEVAQVETQVAGVPLIEALQVEALDHPSVYLVVLQAPEGSIRVDEVVDTVAAAKSENAQSRIYLYR